MVSPVRDTADPPLRPLRNIDQEIDSICRRFVECGAVALLAVDTSPLQGIERNYGAAAYHQVTGRVADRLRDLLVEELREGDQVLLSEFGRSELLVLLFRERHRERFYLGEWPRIVDHLRESLTPPGNRMGYPYVRGALDLSTGVGMALHDPGLRAELLIRRAREDAIADAELNRRLQARERRDSLISLLFTEGLRTVFEPIVDLEKNQVMGFEALARGKPGSGLASPQELFGAAADAQLTFELDCLCRRTALRESKFLPQEAKLFLNCLPSAIHDPAFDGDALRQTLSDHHLQPSDVVFEISEKESIDNFAIFREVCDYYSRLGFQIALDDIGVGYGSLEALTELSPDYVKVDIAFVRGIDSDPARQEVLLALNSIARRIGAEIIAEGIETPEQLETLKRLDVPYGQGFLLARELKPDSDG